MPAEMKRGLTEPMPASPNTIRLLLQPRWFGAMLENACAYQLRFPHSPFSVKVRAIPLRHSTLRALPGLQLLTRNYCPVRESNGRDATGGVREQIDSDRAGPRIGPLDLSNNALECRRVATQGLAGKFSGL